MMKGIRFIGRSSNDNPVSHIQYNSGQYNSVSHIVAKLPLRHSCDRTFLFPLMSIHWAMLTLRVFT